MMKLEMHISQTLGYTSKCRQNLANQIRRGPLMDRMVSAVITANSGTITSKRMNTHHRRQDAGNWQERALVALRSAPGRYVSAEHLHAVEVGEANRVPVKRFRAWVAQMLDSKQIKMQKGPTAFTESMETDPPQQRVMQLGTE